MSNFIIKNNVLSTHPSKKTKNLSIYELVKKQGCATQCLLHLSQVENPDSALERSNSFSNIDVSPWTNSVFKPQINKQGQKIRFSDCEIKANVSFVERKGKKQKFLDNKENKKQKQNSLKGQVKLFRRNSQANKNSYSAIARYNDFTYDLAGKNKFCFEETYNEQTTYTQCNYPNSSNCRKVSTAKKKARVFSKFDKQNCVTEFITCMIPRQQEKLISDFNVQERENKFQKRQSNDYVNGSAIGTTFHNCTWFSNQFENKIPKQPQTSFIQNQRKNLSNNSRHQKQIFGLGKSQTKRRYCSSNQNLSRIAIEDIFQSELAYGNEQFCRIKMKIMHSAQKQSQIDSLPLQAKSSNKIINKFMRQSAFKKSKGKTKGVSLSCCSKTQISDTNYESSNPLTKHLYEKYRMLVHREK